MKFALNQPLNRYQEHVLFAEQNFKDAQLIPLGAPKTNFNRGISLRALAEYESQQEAEAYEIPDLIEMSDPHYRIFLDTQELPESLRSGSPHHYWADDEGL